MTKTYEALGPLRLSMFVLIDEEKQEINFINGRRYPSKICGTFTTSDTKIQKALENDDRFNKSYKLKEDEPERPPTPTERVVSLQEENTALKKENKELKEKLESFEGKKDITSVAGVINAQQAREYLIQNFPDQDSTHLKNKVAITSAAKKLNVEFPDWQ